MGILAQAGGNTATALSAAERRLLGRLGAALVGEWNNLPMPLRRAIYDRAVSKLRAVNITALIDAPGFSDVLDDLLVAVAP